jgi:hypothetical protein
LNIVCTIKAMGAAATYTVMLVVLDGVTKTARY